MTQGQQSLSHLSSDVVWQTFATFASLKHIMFGHGASMANGDGFAS